MAAVAFFIKITQSTSDDVRVSVYNVTDTSTPIAYVQQNAPHLDQQFSFLGLPRINFIYKVQEYEINGNTFISDLGQANFVPANDELEFKDSVLINPGTDLIPGTEDIWPTGVNTVIIPDFIGYELQAFGRPGQYPFKRAPGYEIDCEFDPTTGELILNGGDQFNADDYIYFEFATIVRESSGGVPSGIGSGSTGFSDILVVTANTTLTIDDIGKKILIAPAGNYLEITLPDYTGIIANVITYFEMVHSAGAKCARIKCFSGQTISWLEGPADLYICPDESFELYKRLVSTGVYQWRIQNIPVGFTTVGELFFSDMALDKLGNAIAATGANLDYQQYARLYNRRVVLNGDALTYAGWSGANIFNRMKFSLKDTASNNFRIPDLQTTPVYLRSSNGVDAPGDYLADKMLFHQHAASSNVAIDKSDAVWGYYSSLVNHVGKYTGSGNYYPDLTSQPLEFNSGTGLYEFIGSSENTVRSRIGRLCIRY